MRARRGQRGFVLLLSVILLLSISVIAAAFISLSIIRTRSVAGGLASTKAFWLAEAGIQQVISRIKTDAAYRNAPANITATSLGDGTYAVSVVKQTGQTIYNVTSTGTVADVARNIGQTVTFSSTSWAAPFANYGAFAGAGSISLQNNNNKITGDAYTSGTVTTSGTSSVTGTVYANSGSGNYARLPLPIPNIPAPTLTRTYYTALITTAGTYARRDMTYSTLNLAGGTVYVNGRVTANNITGPGTVVCTGNFVIGGGTVGPNVTIISNATLSSSNNSRIQTGAVMYATTSISLTANNIVVDNAALITPGTMTLGATHFTFNGAIFSGGNLVLQSGAVVSGAVVSGRNITMSGSAKIVQNMNLLPLTVPNGIAAGTAAASVLLSNWQGS